MTFGRSLDLGRNTYQNVLTNARCQESLACFVTILEEIFSIPEYVWSLTPPSLCTVLPQRHLPSMLFTYMLPGTIFVPPQLRLQGSHGHTNKRAKP